MDRASEDDVEAANARDEARGRTLLKRKSVLMGIAASMGVALAGSEQSSAAAGTLKPIAATVPGYPLNWKASTAYALGQQVVSPNNDVVSAKIAHTSSATYTADTVKWLLSSTYGRLNSIDIRNKGAVAGPSNSAAAFQLAMSAAKASSAVLPFGLGSDPHSSVVIDIPAGVYTISTLQGLVGAEAMVSKSVGVKMRGAGLGLTVIIFKPATAGALCRNDYWLGVSFEGITFVAGTPGCTFMESYTTHNAQRYSFTACTFEAFKYVIDLQGDNNNSEFFFANCHSSGLEAGGAFFYIGDTNTSDQFLNYWFYGCTHWSTSAPFIDAARGGHFHIYGLDASDWGGALTTTGHLFILRGTSHALGVCLFQVFGLRVEAKSVFAALLYSQWPQGNVTFNGIDWTSQAWNIAYGDIINIEYANTDGALYTFRDSSLAGGVKVKFSVNDWEHLHGIKFENCTWLQKASPSDVVTYDAAGNVNAENPPPVKFINCRAGAEYSSPFSANGAAVWDAVIGYRGDLLQTIQPRSLSVRQVHGVPSGSNTPKIILPVGALITGLRALSPAGAVGEGDGGVWTLRTTDVVPIAVASVTVAGAMADGFDVASAVAAPFWCNTKARATLTITPTGVGQANLAALLLITGYW